MADPLWVCRQAADEVAMIRMGERGSSIGHPFAKEVVSTGRVDRHLCRA